MDLQQLRDGINDIDSQIEQLFIKRMELCYNVAEYKIENNLPVFQSDREVEIINRVRGNMPEDLEGSAEVLFTTLMDISKCKQYQRFFADQNKIDYEPLDLSGNHKVAVPGISGSFTHIACQNVFDDFTPVFYDGFEDVFCAVENGETEFGIVPIVNSTAGSVGQTYELLKEYDLKIFGTTKVQIAHCLAVKKGTAFEDITAIYSHKQALMQCSEFIKENNLETHKSANTSLAASFIKDSDEPYAAICSEQCANEQGLEIINRDISDAEKNYTRFIVISKKILRSENANIVSVSLALPHTSSALYRLLTKFSVAGLNLTMIESRQIANTDFDVVFYMDFEGAINSPDVAKLMSELAAELSYFKFLGNYEEM